MRRAFPEEVQAAAQSDPRAPAAPGGPAAADPLALDTQPPIDHGSGETLPFELALGEAPDAARTTAEVVNQLYGAAPTAIAANVLCALICSYALWPAVDPKRLLIWLVLIFGVTLARASFVVSYHRSRDKSPLSCTQWLKGMRASVLGTGAVWGLAGILLYPPGDFAHQIVLTALLVGVTAAVVISNSADRIGATGFAVLVVAPFAIYTQLLEGENNRVQGALAVVYLGFIIASVRRISKRTLQNIYLRFEATARAEALKLSMEHYRLLLNHLPVGVLHYDSRYRITYCNLQLKSLLGTNRESLLGEDLHQWNEPVVLATLKKAVAEGASTRCEGRHDAALGAFRGWVSLIATPSRDAGGKVAGGIAIIEDITERRTNQDEIRRLVFSDALTGLPNRRLLLERLKQARIGCEASKHWGALLFVDLDNFKSLNDTRGHDIGDELLKQVAERLATCIRSTDSVARFGGDEFLLLLENLPGNAQDAAARAQKVGEKILAALNQPYRLGTYEHYCTPSIGATIFGDRAVSEEELLKQADLAMYQAKAAGRNNLRFFDPQSQSAIASRSALEADLRTALRLRQFILHYQAVVDGSGTVVGAESLVRWVHATRGLVSPADFIPVAEETGLILPLGLWVLEQACSQLARWSQQEAFRHLSVSVNVSARQMRQPDFVQQILAVVLESGADARRLKLELTESMFVDDVEDTISKMKALNAAGVGFSLDDFGTGFSSLSYLKRLPLDQLKIDKSFVSNLEWDDSDASICAATIGLAHNLGIRVVAEGVETEAQRYFLHTVHRCDYLQGYLFSRPLALAAFEEFQTSRLSSSLAQ